MQKTAYKLMIYLCFIGALSLSIGCSGESDGENQGQLDENQDTDGTGDNSGDGSGDNSGDGSTTNSNDGNGDGSDTNSNDGNGDGSDTNSNDGNGDGSTTNSNDGNGDGSEDRCQTNDNCATSEICDIPSGLCVTPPVSDDVKCPDSDHTIPLINAVGTPDGAGGLSYTSSSGEFAETSFITCYQNTEHIWTTAPTILAIDTPGDDDLIVEVVGDGDFQPTVVLQSHQCQPEEWASYPHCAVQSDGGTARAYLPNPDDRVYIIISGVNGMSGDFTVYSYRQPLLEAGETCLTDPTFGSCESDLRCTADDDQSGFCLPEKMPGEECDLDGIADVCLSNHTCFGDGQGVCREQCHGSSCSQGGQDCSMIFDDGGVCLPAVSLGAACDVDGVENVCGYPNQCDPITETCIEGCNFHSQFDSPDYACSLETDACVDPNSDSAGTCRPARELGESCDPQGVDNACRSFYDDEYFDTVYSGCHAASGELSGTCRKMCGRNNPRNFNMGNCLPGQELCVDDDPNSYGFCVPIVAEGESCDPFMEMSLCDPSRGMCADDGTGEYRCLHVGSCELPHELDQIGVTLTPNYFIGLSNTRGAGNSHETLYCSDFRGQDEVYLLSVPVDADVVLEARGLSESGELDDTWRAPQTALSVRTDCADVFSETYCQNTPEPTWYEERLELQGLLAGEQYYVIVDEYRSDGQVGPGGYHLLEARIIPHVEEDQSCDPARQANRCTSNTFCHPDTEICSPHICGDGIVSGAEECDPGNQSAGDGCDAYCEREIFTEVEPNNGQHVANDIGSNSRIAGTLSGSDSYDYFFTTLSHPESALNVRLFLHNGDQECIPNLEVRHGSRSSSCVLELENILPGTLTNDRFVFDVYGWVNQTTPYVVDIDIEFVPFQVLQEGESCDPAGSDVEYCDEDLICVPAVGGATCEVSFCGDGVVDYEAGEECDAGAAVSAHCDACVMNVIDEWEPNNAFFAANDLGVITPVAGTHLRVRGYHAQASDADYFAFSTLEGGNLRAYLHNDEGSCHRGVIQVYDSLQNPLLEATNWSCASINWLNWDNPVGWGLPAGDYYLRVQSENAGADTPYYLDLAIDPIQPLSLGQACAAECVASETRESFDPNIGEYVYKSYCLNFQACAGDLFCHPDTKSCAEPICGDGIVQDGEQCDDGNTVSGDGCSATCEWEWIEATAPTDTLVDAVEIPQGFQRLKGDATGSSSNGPGHLYEFEVTTASELEALLLGTNCGNTHMELFRTDHPEFRIDAGHVGGSSNELCRRIDARNRREAYVLAPGIYYLEVRTREPYEVHFKVTPHQ